MFHFKIKFFVSRGYPRNRTDGFVSGSTDRYWYSPFHNPLPVCSACLFLYLSIVCTGIEYSQGTGGGGWVDEFV